MDISSSLGMPMHPKKYPRSTSVKAWGCPRGTPFFIGKKSGHLSRHYIFIASCIMHFLGASVAFVFSFLLLYLLQ
jgi:hypothetical protein